VVDLLVALLVIFGGLFFLVALNEYVERKKKREESV